MIADFLKNYTWVLYVLVVILQLVFIGLITVQGISRKMGYKLLKRGILNGTVRNAGDIRGIHGHSASSMPFINYLHEFIFYLRKTMQNDCDNFNKINIFIDEIILEEQMKTPFGDVEQYEQQLLKAIEDAAQNGEKQLIHSELGHLATSIKNSQKKIKNLNQIKTWSIPFSIVSVLITVGLWLLGTPISKKDLETIKDNTRSVLVEVLDSSHTMQMRKME